MIFVTWPWPDGPPVSGRDEREFVSSGRLDDAGRREVTFCPLGERW